MRDRPPEVVVNASVFDVEELDHEGVDYLKEAVKCFLLVDHVLDPVVQRGLQSLAEEHRLVLSQDLVEHAKHLGTLTEVDQVKETLHDQFEIDGVIGVLLELTGLHRKVLRLQPLQAVLESLVDLGHITRQV